MNVFVKEGVTFRFAQMTDNTQCKQWVLDNFDKWEPFTFQCFRQVADSSKIAIDIGAWIGLTGIWLSKYFKHVVCVEADLLSVRALEANLIASDCDNYTIIPSAIYHTNTTLYFGPNSFRPNATLNESMSQLKSISDKSDDYSVDTVTLADIVGGLSIPDIGLLKVDIEGGEEHIIEDIMTFSAQHCIPVLLSFHLSWWRDQNIGRFAELFKCSTTQKINMRSDTGEQVTDMPKFIASHPFATLFCTYEPLWPVGANE